MPDDVAALQALVLAQRSQQAERDAEIEHLKLVIAKFKRMQFGRSSEQLDEMIGQLELSLEELEGVRAERMVPAQQRHGEVSDSDPGEGQADRRRRRTRLTAAALGKPLRASLSPALPAQTGMILAADDNFKRGNLG